MKEELTSYEAETQRQEKEVLLPEHAEQAGETIQVKVESKAEAVAEKPQAEAVAEATEAVAEAKPLSGQAETFQQLGKPENESDEAMAHVVSHDALRFQRDRILKNLRRQEKLPQRMLSRVVHQPVVRGSSELAAKTVSRPSALLGGGLVALLGSGSYLILAKYIGFTYNYTLSLALFVGGFVFGLMLELMVHLATASRRQIN